MSTEARLRIGLAQLNFLVGDAQGNAARVIDSVARASADLKPDLLLFPELTLSGYPPEDLLFHGGFRQAIAAHRDFGADRVPPFSPLATQKNDIWHQGRDPVAFAAQMNTLRRRAL